MFKRIRDFVRRKRYIFNIRRLYRPLDSIKIDRPVFFLGVQGGGLTLLVKAFQRHRKICFCKGNSNHWDAADNEMQVNIFDMPEELSLRNNKVYHKKYKTNIFRYWTYALNDTLSLYRLNSEKLSPDLSNSFKKVIRKIISAYAHNPDDCRFIDKSQLFTVNLLSVYRLLKETNPFFVLVVRNPFAMCKRVAEKYYENPNKNNFSFSKETSLRLCCQHWKNSYESALNDGKDVPNVKIVKFEDFLSCPSEFLKEICEFIELEFDTDIVPAPNQKSTIYSQMNSRWYPIRSNSNEKYVNSLTKNDIEIIKEECGELIKEFGYELI